MALRINRFELVRTRCPLPVVENAEPRRGRGTGAGPLVIPCPTFIYLPSSSSVLLGNASPRQLTSSNPSPERVIMQPDPANDEDYLSEEDSDFAPEDAAAEESSVSEDDEVPDPEKTAQPKRKRQDGEDAAEDAGFENSGDEAIIGKGKKRQKKLKRNIDEGGEGGLIKTRRMRAAEYVISASLVKANFLSD